MKVSICTSVLNQSSYLARMIESVRAQTFQDWELVIVDDGSTDDIAGLVAGFDDERIKLHRFETNQGIPHGLNWAFANSTGEYLQPLSADEFIWDRKLEVQVEWLDAHPDIGCTWGLPTPNVGQAWPLGEAPTWQQFQVRAHNRSSQAWLRTLLNLESVPIGGASMLMRRSCYEAIGGIDPQFHACSDLEWFVRFFEQFQGMVLPYRLADAVHPEGRQSTLKQEQFADELKLLRSKHPMQFPPVGGKVSIGIPNYNMAQFVEQAINAALAQTYADIEVLVLDDKSTDTSVEVIQAYTDPRIRFLQFDENRGTVAAINQMAAMATGNFYLSLAADDLIDPTTVERMVAEFTRDPWLEFVATQTDFMDADGKPYTADHAFKQIAKASNKSRETWLQQLYYGNVYFGAGMYRRSTLLELGGWDAQHGVLTDYEMYLRLLQRENIHIIEENLTHTRIHAGNKSILDVTEARKLKQRYHDAKLPFYKPRQKVILATPFYEMRGFSPYIQSLTQTINVLMRLGVEYEWWELSGDSYVDRAKNTLFTKFLEDPDATDIFMIDSDMQWSPMSVWQVLQLPEEIVMGSYPQKNMWETWTALPQLVEREGRHFPIGRDLPDGSALIQAAYIAGGWLRIKRSALEAYKEKYPQYRYYDPGADPATPDREYVAFFECERAQHNDAGPMLRWGEDRVFGKRMKAIGIDAWIYPNVDFGHYGIKGWMGNYDKHLRKPQEEAITP